MTYVMLMSEEQPPYALPASSIQTQPQTAQDAPEPSIIRDPYPDLSPRHQRFIDALIANGGNQTQAYISAGYSPESAQPDSSQLVSNPMVKLAYDIRLADLAARAHVSQDQLLASLNVDAFGTRTAVYDPNSWVAKPMDQWPDELQRAVEGVDVEEHETTSADGRTTITRKIKIRFPSRLKAKEMLGEYLNLWEKSASGKAWSLEINVDARTQTANISGNITTENTGDQLARSSPINYAQDVGPLNIDLTQPDSPSLSTPDS